ncbi:Uncharacterized protein APZ42_012641 [Daphnia magna]|uniref:Uncharacterized protein n=1 Tax=Daphnia magna TaxID=35525 RepID=A0A162RMJ2_9CRUS|nr:Uncharacterized protein APZ42_012641 [Daphnia magna]
MESISSVTSLINAPLPPIISLKIAVSNSPCGIVYDLSADFQCWIRCDPKSSRSGHCLTTKANRNANMQKRSDYVC